MLRERLIHTAYALHFSAADAASLYDEQAELTAGPMQADYALEAKRWRVASDQAHDLVKVWSAFPRHTFDDTPAVADASLPTDEPQEWALARLDVAIRHLFLAGRQLRAIPSGTPELAQGQISDILGELDVAIRNIQSYSLGRGQHE